MQYFRCWPRDRIRVRFSVKSALLIGFMYWDEAKVYLMVRIILGTRLDLRFHTP